MNKLKFQIDEDISLKQLKQEDYLDIFNTIDREREHLGPWLPFVALTVNPEFSQNAVKSMMKASKDGFNYTFTIRYKNNFIGMIGYKGADKANKEIEIGYWMSEAYQGKGIMSRSVQQLCNFAFNDLDFHRVLIKCAVGNMHSKAIPLRLGFKLEGIEREGELLTGGIYTDIEVYSKLVTDV